MALIKVLKILQCSNLGGMEQSVYKVMPWLVARGISFSIASPRPFGAGKTILRGFDSAAFDAEYSGKFGRKSHKVFSRRISIKAEGCQHVWVTGSDIASLRAIMPLRLPKLFGHHYHHFETRISFLKWKIFYEIFCRQCDWVTYPTDFVRNEGMLICPWLKTRSSVVRQHFPIVENTADEKIAARRFFGIPDDAFVIGNAGWLIQRKRWDVFLHVAELVLNAVPDAIFLIAGGGEQESALRLRVERMVNGNRILFLGWIADLDCFYRSIDVLLFNSDFDAFGRTPGESMGYGVIPVASVQRGGLKELIRNGANGFISNIHDVKQLATHIVELRNNPFLLNELRDAGQATLAELHSKDSEGAFYLNEFSK